MAELALIKAIQEKGPKCEEMGKLIESKAAQKYNTEEADFKFMSYAVWWIRQAILQALSEKR